MRTASTFLSAGLIASFVCCLFGALASWVLWSYLLATGFEEEPGFYARLAVKGGGFTILAAGALLVLARQRELPPVSRNRIQRAALDRKLILLGAALFGFVALLMLPRLGAWPWAAPDELHHLVVARNLAEHGAYASGHVETGLTHFDPYDSVGPAVIVPVAWAFKLFGVDLAHARYLMAMFYLVFTVLIYALCAPVCGRAAGAFSVVFATLAFGSIYLGRTLYGEVPALMFLLAGLLRWRRSINLAFSKGPKAGVIPSDSEEPQYALIRVFSGKRFFAIAQNDGKRKFGTEGNGAAPGAFLSAYVAGTWFGLAALTKAFIWVGVCAFAGVWVYDRLTTRAIRWPHVLMPALGVVTVYAVWAWVRAWMGGGENAPVLMMYRHNLMFGFDSTWTGLAWLLGQPVSLALAGVSLAFVCPKIFADRYDPALIVLFLMAILFLFWWLFFTTGRIPRYVWYSAAIAGMFTGPLIAWAGKSAWTGVLSGPGRVACGGILTAALVTAVVRNAHDFRGIFTLDETADDVAVARLVRGLPSKTKVATTFWPLERAVNFFASRPIDAREPGDNALSRYDVIIYDVATQAAPPGFRETSRIGRYGILARENSVDSGRN